MDTSEIQLGNDLDNVNIDPPVSNVTISSISMCEDLTGGKEGSLPVEYTDTTTV